MTLLSMTTVSAASDTRWIDKGVTGDTGNTGVTGNASLNIQSEEKMSNYDPDYDFRTWNEKYHDDNTWQRERGISLDPLDDPYLYYCDVCKAEVKVIEIEGSNVFDRYDYILCADCGADESHLEDRGVKVSEK